MSPTPTESLQTPTSQDENDSREGLSNYGEGQGSGKDC